MKVYILAVVLLVTQAGCNGQSAYDQAKKTEKAIKDAPRPNEIATSAGGWTMTAKVNGKLWSATSMLAPPLAGSMVGYVGEKSYIMMYTFDKRSAKVGEKATLGNGYSVDYWISGGDVYSNYNGIMEITAIKGNWVEGKFSFMAKGLTVTDGFYRVQL